jgi:hypothetical protein
MTIVGVDFNMKTGYIYVTVFLNAWFKDVHSFRDVQEMINKRGMAYAKIVIDHKNFNLYYR